MGRVRPFVYALFPLFSSCCGRKRLVFFRVLPSSLKPHPCAAACHTACSTRGDRLLRALGSQGSAGHRSPPLFFWLPRICYPTSSLSLSRHPRIRRGTLRWLCVSTRVRDLPRRHRGDVEIPLLATLGITRLQACADSRSLARCLRDRSESIHRSLFRAPRPVRKKRGHKKNWCVSPQTAHFTVREKHKTFHVHLRQQRCSVSKHLVQDAACRAVRLMLLCAATMPESR